MLLPLVLGAHMAAADEVTLLAFGDSLIHGYGLPHGQGFVPQLEGWLRERGAEVRVINGGVSGDTSAGGAARIGWSLTGEVGAVIVALGGNDVLRGLPAGEARQNLAAILAAIRAEGLPVLLVGIRAPGNFGPSYAADFATLYRDLAAAHDIPLFASFLQGLEDVGDRNVVLRDYMQDDALHPNAAGVALIVAAMGPSVLRLLKAAN